MKSLLPVLVTLLAPMSVMAAHWETDYKAALEVAKKENKPIFVHFANLESSIACKSKFDQVGNVADQFVLLRADRATDEGSELFRLFEIDGQDGCVVVDKTQQWQFCRFEQKLSADEISTVMTKTADANGKPVYAVELSSPTATYEFKPCLRCMGR